MSLAGNRDPTHQPEPSPASDHGSSFPEQDAAGAPAIADDRERSLDPQAVTAQRLAGAVGSGVLSLGLLAGMTVWLFAAPPPLPAPGLLLSGAWLLLSSAVTTLALWYPAVSYRHTSYRVSRQGILICRGVLWRSVISVPRSRVQHTDVSQGPIERLFDLATLVIYTAGTQHASVSLSGLPQSTAFRIRDHLLEGGADDAV